MRIVGGSFGGRTLVTPKGDATRPTSDRVREAVFSTLQTRFDAVDGARVLDLFAGSGALGLEALSRGARLVTFVESGRAARDALRRNIETLGVSSASSIDARDAFRIARTALNTGPFSLLLLDPPYRIEPARVRELMEGLASIGSLVAGAVTVYEHHSGVVPEWPTGFAEAGNRVYGDTTVSYALWNAEEEHLR